MLHEVPCCGQRLYKTAGLVAGLGFGPVSPGRRVFEPVTPGHEGFELVPPGQEAKEDGE